MRLRLSVLASLVAVLVTGSVTSAVSAAPRHNDGLTINAVPHRIIAGEGVLIYGRLKGPDSAHQTIRLFHKIAPRPGYSLVGVTTTDAAGFYEFTRAEGVVLTNRSWFSRGPNATHSRTVYERVAALVSLNASSTVLDTRQPVVFTGTVTPSHRFQRVILQEQNATGDDWHTLKTGFTNSGSSFSITYRWQVPGVHEVRAVFPGDARNTRGASDPVTVTVQQAQVPDFTINSSAPVINYGGSATISGVLDKPGTTTPDPGVPVTLLGKTVGTPGYTALASTPTGSDGSYSFPNQAPTHNTIYLVRVTMTPSRHSATLFEGVRSTVSIADSPSTNTGPTGSTVTFTGTVLPGASGEEVDLQRQGRDGDWHTVEATVTNGASGYSLSWTLGDAGTEVFRTRVLADGLNLSGASTPVSIVVTAPSSLTALPPPS